MTSYCFEACFSNRTLKIKSDECIKTCYDKYLQSITTVMQTVVEEGRQCQSEYINYAVGLEKRDRVNELAFPHGGRGQIMGEGDKATRFYAFEAYRYSDNLKHGR